jgi:Penicillin tolerance protein
VIFGKPDHAEVIGLMGQTDCQRRVVHGTQDLEGIDFTHPIECFSQTTMSPTDYRSIASAIRGNMVKALGSNDIHLVVHETCCSQVASRQEQLVAFAQQHDVVLFVSGKKSSNGQMLCRICQQANPRTHMVSHPEEVQESWLENAETVGICGATSTPLWLMQAVASRAEEIGKSQETPLPAGQPCSTR